MKLFVLIALLIATIQGQQYFCADLFQQSQTCQGTSDASYCQILDVCIPFGGASIQAACQASSSGNFTSYADELCQMPIPNGDLPLAPDACTPTATGGGLMLNDGQCGVPAPAFNGFARLSVFGDNLCQGPAAIILDTQAPDTCINGPDNMNLMVACSGDAIELTIFADTNCATSLITTEIPQGACNDGALIECNPDAGSASTLTISFALIFLSALFF